MKILSLDFETSIGKTIHGSSFRDPANDIFTVIAANHPENVEVLHKKEGFKRKLPPEQLKDVDLIVGHNLMFDLSYIINDEQVRDLLINGGKIWDTQLAEYLLTGHQHQYASLAELQEKYLGEKIKPSRIGFLFKKGIGADKILAKQDKCLRLFKLYNEYCESDGSTPLLIFKAQYARAKHENMLPLIEMYNDYLISLIIVSTTGIKVDIIACEKTLKEFTEQYLLHLEKAQNILKQYWTDPRLPEFNINSTIHKSAVLFGGEIPVKVREHVGMFKNGNPRYLWVPQSVYIDGFHVPTSVTTPTSKEGVYATTEGVMKKIALNTKNCELKEYCEVQKKAMAYKKAAQTYCQAFINYSVNEHLYPNFNNTATDTGRLSSSEPNMQNIATKNEFGERLHSLLIAPTEWTAVSIDFSQLEIWVLAWLSRDTNLTNDLLNGIDLHIKRLGYYNPEYTYEQLYKFCKIDNDDGWNKQRSHAKTVSYQMAYGAMPPKVSASTGLDIEIVEKIFEQEKLAYPQTAKFQDSVIETINHNTDLSRACNIPSFKKNDNKEGSRIVGRVELLPIFDKDGNKCYNKEYARKIGYWRSVTGHKYSFLESGRYTKRGLMRNFSWTQPKDYPMQGTAADIQGMTTAELRKALLLKLDKIKMVNEIHDSKWFYVRNDVLEDCLKWLKETIENVPAIVLRRFGVEVPFKFPVEIKIGQNFGIMSKYEVKQWQIM